DESAAVRHLRRDVRSRQRRSRSHIRHSSCSPLILGENQPACRRIYLVVPGVDVGAQYAEMKSSGVHYRICAPRFAISENRENLSGSRGSPSLIAPVRRKTAVWAHVERRGCLGAVSIEPVAEIAMPEESGERRVGIGKLP